jgi:hypothetical protein
MPTLDEAANASTQANTLLSGLRVLSADQSIPFTQYVRYVLPLDGYVFWLATAQTMIQGSLHYPADKQQREDETISISRALFTTGVEVQEFAAIAPDTMWVGEAAGLKFAFSQRGQFYKASGLFHYAGDAVYPAMESQIVNVGAQLSPDTLVVSNSLPAWLALKAYAPQWLIAGNPAIALYPSFAVPDNLRPPYGSVHIAPDQTEPLGAFPVIGYQSAHSHLAADRVRVTLYGTTNAQAAAFFDLVNQYSRDTDTIGMMDPAIIRDEKRTQAELGILAMKKTITFRVSYLQTSMLDVARAMIKTATAAMLPQSFNGAT